MIDKVWDIQTTCEDMAAFLTRGLQIVPRLLDRLRGPSNATDLDALSDALREFVDQSPPTIVLLQRVARFPLVVRRREGETVYLREFGQEVTHSLGHPLPVAGAFRKFSAVSSTFADFMRAHRYDAAVGAFGVFILDLAPAVDKLTPLLKEATALAEAIKAASGST